MNHSTSLFLVAATGLALLGALAHAPAADQDTPPKKEKPKNPPAKPATRPGGYGTAPSTPGYHPGTPTDGSKSSPVPGPSHTIPPTPPAPGSPRTVPTTPGPGAPPPGPSSVTVPGTVRSTTVKSVPVPLVTKPNPNGGYTKTTPSGQPREVMLKRADGEHIQRLTPTGKVSTEVVQRPDGTKLEKHYAPNGQVQKEVVVNKDGTQAVTTRQNGRDGTPRVTETINVDKSGQQVSKTVVVKNTTIVNNNVTVVNNNTTIVNNNTTVRYYDRGHYGYVYRPVYVVNSPIFVSWYDPFWYTPAGVVIIHPFHFAWGWEARPWYHYHRHYWTPYAVYPAPSYWVTDWMIAGYAADQYEASANAAQAREDARIAREDAAKAMQMAQQANDRAEIAEAQRARDEAEARAARAEARAAKAEAQEARAKSGAAEPNPNATPIDDKTKEALKDQIEKEIASKKQIADQTAKGGKPIIPDVTQALADPKHIYPVSKATSVINAKDQSPAGNLTEGDLLKVEPGQESILKGADETTFITMRVMTSKGEEGETPAGTLISVPLRDLQEFDSEFRAKLDQGLAEADKNKDLFKKGS